MSTSSAAGLFGGSTPQTDKPATLALTTGAPNRPSDNLNLALQKPNDNYYQDKDLNWWLSFARTFKSAVKTPLPEDDSDL
ncbi:hypothetical protein KVR01_012930 [Diaporthe batatas]|uniref:uncharacterized protein n=1 Tax=Diaporthe batatas TaxID=748121 RepID=UPI001D035F8C|nr:uncharacterized protein KVR01_012930 [Diaporthe batatas]KAG8157222.1 hypothetical protein KVR01_012930 [Diaporthe batatas]